MKDIIQIAGVIDKKEASLLADCGVEYLGFPLRLPVNAVDHSEEEAAEIIASLPVSCKPVLITYQHKAREILRFCNQMNCFNIQLHGDIEALELQKLKKLQPEISVFKSLVIGEQSNDRLLETVNCLSPYVDAFITDTFDPETGASGATGKTHDWKISATFVKLSPKPVILAGGLNAENVRAAILRVKPAGVDAHTGVEDSKGRKCPYKVRKFIAEARAAFAELNTAN